VVDQPQTTFGEVTADYSCGSFLFSYRTTLIRQRRMKGAKNMTYTHVNAPTQFVQANGIRFAYWRFGTILEPRLLFMQHFRAGMDHWDPSVTDGFAKDRPVILQEKARIVQ
jgi:hypothetical protein